MCTLAVDVMVIFDPVMYTVTENAGSQLYQLRLLGEMERHIVVTVTSEDGTAEGILARIIFLFFLMCIHIQ